MITRMEFFSSILFSLFALATIVLAQDFQILSPNPAAKIRSGATRTGLFTYNSVVIAPPAIPTGFKTQLNVQLSSTTPPGVSISHLSSFFGFSIEMSVAGQVCECLIPSMSTPIVSFLAVGASSLVSRILYLAIQLSRPTIGGRSMSPS